MQIYKVKTTAGSNPDADAAEEWSKDTPPLLRAHLLDANAGDLVYDLDTVDIDLYNTMLVSISFSSGGTAAPKAHVKIPMDKLGFSPSTTITGISLVGETYRDGSRQGVFDILSSTYAMKYYATPDGYLYMQFAPKPGAQEGQTVNMGSYNMSFNVKIDYYNAN